MFIEERKEQVKVILTKAENNLKNFRSKNRKVIDSPDLQLELERFLRDVEIQTQIYITLNQQYEIARIDELKETPSVLILDEGFSPLEKSEPKRKLIVIISFLFGCSFGTIYVLAKKIL